MTRKGGLGRNLDVLLSKTQAVKVSAVKKEEVAQTEGEESNYTFLATNCLQPGQYQPRREMSHEALEELSASIKTQGLLQPLVVRKLATNQYEIIAGERRYRAAKLAGLDRVPVVIQQVDDKTSLAMALVENIQREDLNPMEEARALQRLVDEFELSHQEAALVVSKSRTAVTNLLRLNQLHIEVQQLLEEGELEMGHARALLSLAPLDQVNLAHEAVAKSMTVREVEAQVKRRQHPYLMAQQQRSDVDILEARERQKILKNQLGIQVKVSPSKEGKLKVTLKYDSINQLDELIKKLT